MVHVFCAVSFLASVGQRLVDNLVEPVDIRDFDIRHADSFVGYDPDGRRVLNADPLAQSVVGLYSGGKFPLRIDDKWKSDAVLLGEFLGEGAKVRLRFNARL